MKVRSSNNPSKFLKINLLILSLSLLFPSFSQAADPEAEGETFKPGEMINHHIKDAHSWEIWHGLTVYLPVILYSGERGLEIFSSSNFYNEEHEPVSYKGYALEHGHIVAEGGLHVWDFSITKNVLFLFINAALLLFIFFSVARGYKKNAGGPPRGLQSLFEPVILFVRDEIVKPNVGPKYERYLPYLLTLFFFILFGNILGLFPAAANLTGNIAVTAVMALFTMVVTNFSGNKNYWKHIFNTPGVPWWLKFPIPIMPMVELIGVFTKPFSLLLRLFVAITAGHIVILSLLSMIFIFQLYLVGVASTAIVTIITFIEILVAAIQAYVFTMFSSLYIGMAIEEHH